MTLSPVPSYGTLPRAQGPISGQALSRPRDRLILRFSYMVEHYRRAQPCYATLRPLISSVPDHACSGQSAWAVSLPRLDLLSRLSEKNHKVLLCGYLCTLCGPIALHARKCLADRVRHMPSLLTVGQCPKWRVTSASHLYAQYIICASLAVGMIYMPLFMP